MVRAFNFCIQYSYFPTSFKRAKIIPVPKKGKDLRSASSYRPISLLSSIDKIFEKIILQRLNSFVTENEVINSGQFGFRSEHSTTHQIKRVLKIIRSNKNRRYSTGIIFLDIEKAFDSVWHNGLIFKLHKMQCPSYLVKLIKSFLSNRSFIVEIEGEQSAAKDIPAGVPQGSVLSPLLYSLYTSDFGLPANYDVAFYADDSAFICSGKVSNAIIKRMQTALSSAEEYFLNWKIKINKDKTQAILFPFNKSPKRNPSRVLSFQGHDIVLSKTIKYLGITLDQKLTFKEHVNDVSTKAIRCGRALYPLLNKKSQLNKKNKLLIYKLCIRPILTYGCQIWKNCAKTHRKQLQIIQNKNLKIIFNLSRRFSTRRLHSRYKQKTIDEFVDDLTLTFEDKCRRSNYAHLRNLV